MTDIDTPHREPVFNVPGVVLALLVLFGAIHASAHLMSAEVYQHFIITLALIPARFNGYANEIAGGELAAGTSLITHIGVHIDMVHLLMNAAWFLAFGSIIARRIGAMWFLAFFIAGGVAGGLTFVLFHWGEGIPMIGASGAVSALMGGVLRFLFVAIDRGQGRLLREAPEQIPALPLFDALRHPRVLLTTAVFVAVNLFAIFGFGSFSEAGGVAWEAHLGGYFFGLLCFGLFDIAPRDFSPIAIDVE